MTKEDAATTVTVEWKSPGIGVISGLTADEMDALVRTLDHADLPDGRILHNLKRQMRGYYLPF